MSTFSPKAADLTHDWYVIDAAGKTLGTVAVKAADLLRGKLKTTYAPNADCGDYVVIVNADKIVLTGKKLEQKTYYHHTGYIGHMKKVPYRILMSEKPEFAVRKAVNGMVPGNSLGRKQMTRLFVYAGPEHKHQAQKPQCVEF